MNKFFASLLAFLLLSSTVFANEISKYVKEETFGFKSDIAIFVSNFDNNQIIYEKNKNEPLNPASILKLLTLGASYQALGEDYNFQTSLYKDCENNVYIKLGADPLFTKNDLNNLVSSLKNEEINNIYIDNSIIKSEDYPTSWLDEDKWPNSGFITPYIIDNNMVKIALHRSSLATKVDIIQNDEYKLPIVNELKLGDVQEIRIERNSLESPIINFKGTILKDDILNLYVLNPEINFQVKLQKILQKNNVVYKNIIQAKNVPTGAVELAIISHSLDEVSKLILFESDNFASEIVFRVAASKYFNKTAGLDEAIKMFSEYYGYQLKKSEQIADASGVSRQNLLSVQTITQILNDIFKKTKILEIMPSANEGTMKDRLIFLQNNLKAKTGTMKNYSSIVGYMQTRQKNNVYFISVVQNSPKRRSLLKNFENNLIGIIYKKY